MQPNTMSFLTGFVFAISSLPLYYCASLIRNTTYGTICGVMSSQVPVEQYLGVPYAKPPTDDLRFEPPQRPDSWNDTKYTTVLSGPCTQNVGDDLDFTYILSFNNNLDVTPSNEDCLYLNIYVPQMPEEGNLSTLFYIHGGSNRYGMGGMLSGDKLAAEAGIIVITINYRQGLFGFLAMKDYNITGNYGLLDQLFALRWVKENIMYFGGDPDRITIEGHSAGASDVGLLMSSQKTEGLLRNVIIHSGSPLALWAFSGPKCAQGNNVNSSKLYNTWPKNKDDKNKTFKEFVKHLPRKSILELWKREQEALPVSIVYLPPVVDGIVLNERPENFFRNAGSFNGESILLAFTNDETRKSGGNKDLIDIYRRFVPPSCDIEDEVTNVTNLFYKEQNTSRDLYEKMEADFTILAPLMKLADDLTQEKKLYLFDFAYIPPGSKDKAVEHGDDLFYQFGYKIDKTESSVKISKAMMKIWGNFVKFGKLSLDGTRNEFKSYNKVYHKLSVNGSDVILSENVNFRGEIMNYWNNIVSKKDLCTEKDNGNDGSTIFVVLAVAIAVVVTTGICVVIIICCCKRREEFRKVPTKMPDNI